MQAPAHNHENTIFQRRHCPFKNWYKEKMQEKYNIRMYSSKNKLLRHA